MPLLRAVAAALLLTCLTASGMPGAPGAPGATRGDDPPTFRTERLADGVWLLQPTAPPGFGGDANTVVVAGDGEALVVDAHFSAASTRAAVAAIRRVTALPVRWVVSTHWHPDHVTGNAEYRRAWPDATFIAHEAMAQDLATEGARGRTSFLASVPGTAAYLRQRIASRRGVDGQPADTAELRAFASYVALIERWAAESASFVAVAPALTFRDRLTLTLGGRRVEILHLGRGHTRGDAVVHLPDDSLLVAGDLVVRPVPFIGTTSFPREYGATLERLLALPHRAIVPGHGDVLHDDAYVRDVRDLTMAIHRQVDSLAARGDSLGAVRRAVNLDRFRVRFAGADRLRNALFAEYVVSSAIPKAYADYVARQQ